MQWSLSRGLIIPCYLTQEIWQIDPAKFRAGRIAERVLVELSVPVAVRGKPLTPNPSVGIAVFPDDGTDAESLLGKAKEAVALATRAGGGVYRFPSSPMTGLVSSSPGETSPRSTPSPRRSWRTAA